MKKLIFLTGFMGAGKTTLGKALAKKLQCSFIDLDAQIESSQQRSISSIFAQEGEAAFRQMETDELKMVCKNEPAVIATGGGIVTREVNVSIMREAGTILFIDVPFDVLIKRLQGCNKRPLLKSDDVKKLFDKRQTAYHDAALIVSVSSQDSKKKVLHKMLKLIGFEK